MLQFWKKILNENWKFWEIQNKIKNDFGQNITENREFGYEIILQFKLDKFFLWIFFFNIFIVSKSK